MLLVFCSQSVSCLEDSSAVGFAHLVWFRSSFIKFHHANTNCLKFLLISNMCNCAANCSHKLYGHGPTSVLSIYLSRRHTDWRHSNDCHSSRTSSNDRFSVWTKNNDIIDNGSCVYFYISLFLQNTLPVGCHLWSTQQNQYLSSGSRQSRVRKMWQVCPYLQNGYWPRCESKFCWVHSLRRLRICLP